MTFLSLIISFFIFFYFLINFKLKTKKKTKYPNPSLRHFPSPLFSHLLHRLTPLNQTTITTLHHLLPASFTLKLHPLMFKVSPLHLTSSSDTTTDHWKHVWNSDDDFRWWRTGEGDRWLPRKKIHSATFSYLVQICRRPHICKSGL